MIGAQTGANKHVFQRKQNFHFQNLFIFNWKYNQTNVSNFPKKMGKF